MIERHGRVTAGAIGDSIAVATGANGGRVRPESVKAGMRKARLARVRASRREPHRPRRRAAGGPRGVQRDA